MSDNELRNDSGEVVKRVEQSPQFFFDKREKVPEPKKPEPDISQDRAGELVKDVLHAGIMHKVQTDDEVKERVLGTADKVIRTRLDVEENIAERADKKAFFEANEAACSYFGYDEHTTSKSHVKMMRAWAWFFNALYILTIGYVIVAPIVFFASKLRVVVKKTWVVMILAVIIYVAVALSPLIISWLGRL